MKRSLELLSPAANADIAIQAILHGADAVYIGAPSHGARKSAANSIEDIKRVVEFAHVFHARVYVTVNTVVYDSELADVEKMIWELWRVGVDALIVQDMGILRLNLPPIALHASTQCDTRTPQKARFLQDAGFSQIVLARELTFQEIADICAAVTVPVECFVHGALCVSYSGVCHASQAFMGRSANRGECAQLCRLPYQLTDASGKPIGAPQHLLSLKDFNLLDSLEHLIEAGVSSFKIEGRLKEAGYVKNITAAYSTRLNEIIASRPDLLKRSSAGIVSLSFTPDPYKSFNRGFTHYFTSERRPKGISEPRTPKSMGEPITDIQQLNSGDGISWFDNEGNYCGMQVNRAYKTVEGPKGIRLPKGVKIHRTSDRVWNSLMAKETATRKIPVDITVYSNRITAADARGVSVTISLDGPRDKANKPMDLRGIFSKLGNTDYILQRFENNLPEDVFIPASYLTAVRRDLISALDKGNMATYPLTLRAKENTTADFGVRELDYTYNVANRLARRFYAEHGVAETEPAAELLDKSKLADRQVMRTRHCLLREMGLCKKNTPKSKLPAEPLFLTSNGVRFRAVFDCNLCEMKLFKA